MIRWLTYWDKVCRVSVGSALLGRGQSVGQSVKGAAGVEGWRLGAMSHELQSALESQAPEFWADCSRQADVFSQGKVRRSCTQQLARPPTSSTGMTR